MKKVCGEPLRQERHGSGLGRAVSFGIKVKLRATPSGWSRSIWIVMEMRSRFWFCLTGRLATKAVNRALPTLSLRRVLLNRNQPFKGRHLARHYNIFTQ